jgi:hypothetical protein
LEPTLFVTISNDLIKRVLPLTGVSKNTYNIVPQCHRILPYSFLKCLSVGEVRRKCCYELRSSFGQVDVGEVSDNMLTAYIDDMRETHDSAVDRVKINVASFKESAKLASSSKNVGLFDALLRVQWLICRIFISVSCLNSY